MAKLPAACVEDLTNFERIEDVKSSALHEALMDLKAKDGARDELVFKIEELEQRQKQAYLRLYEKVGTEINAKMHKSLQEHERQV